MSCSGGGAPAEDGYHPRTPGTEPSGVVSECDFRYENFEVEDIYKRWDDLVDADKFPKYEAFLRGLAASVCSSPRSNCPRCVLL